MAAPFTLSDLTLNEYATLARMIGADPASAMTAPTSTKYAEAHAGLLVMRHRRDGNTAFQLADAMSLTLVDVNTRLGLIAADDDADDADPGESVDDQAADAALEATGAAVDPTVPPASHGSATSPATPPPSSETAPAPR